MDKVAVTKSKLDALAARIGAKAGKACPMTIAQMQAAVDGMGAPASPPVTYDQVNAAAAGYLAAAAGYTAADRSSSVVAAYAAEARAADYRGDSPAPVSLALPAGRLSLRDASGGQLSEVVAAGARGIYGLTPGAVGADYTVVSPTSGEVAACGHITPTGALRMIRVGTTREEHSPWNMRDLGGWACDGGAVRYGRLLRGSELDAGTWYGTVLGDGDKAVMRGLLGIREEIDLRTDTETAGRTSSAVGGGVKYFHHTVLPYADGVTADGAGLGYAPLLREIFDCAVSGRTAYIHCVGGADRTGTVCAILEALLGVSLPDIEKDYELTSFTPQFGTEITTRTRTSDVWVGFVNYIGTMSGATFRDRVVNWAERIGITIDEINAFRAAMTDGTPALLTSTVTPAAVGLSLTSAVSDNTAAATDRYRPYRTVISPALPQGYVIGSVEVKMGGKVITSSVWRGTPAVRRFAVSLTLTGCTSGNTRRTVIEGQSYAAVITASAGYRLDGAPVQVKMGGTKMSSTYYKNGVIAIPSVTGDIEITVTAVSTATAYTNMLPVSTDATGAVYNGKGFKEHTAFGETGAELDRTGKSDSHVAATGFIPIPETENSNLGQIAVRIANAAIVLAAETRLCFYDSAKAFLGMVYGTNMVTDASAATASTKVLAYLDSESHLVKFDPSVLANYYRTSKSKPAAYFRIAGAGIDADTVITVNEEIEE